MMKVTRICAAIAALICIALAVPASATLIPGSWQIQHQYTLGDAEGGVIGNPAANPAIDSVGGANLPLTGTPVYTAGNTSPVAVDFTNAYGSWPTVSTDYYSDPTADYNPIDPTNWGVSFDVHMDSLPGATDDQEAVLVNLGSFTNPSVAIQLFEGAYVLHVPGQMFLQTGVPATVGGWDHIEFAIINGVMDLEVNGVAAGFAYTPWGATHDPVAGITIGAMFANGVGGVQYARGADAAIDNVTLSGIPEPSTFVLASLVIATGLVACKRRT